MLGLITFTNYFLYLLSRPGIQDFQGSQNVLGEKCAYVKNVARMFRQHRGTAAMCVSFNFLLISFVQKCATTFSHDHISTQSNIRPSYFQPLSPELSALHKRLIIVELRNV